MPRTAIKITEDILNAAAEITGSKAKFGDDVYVIVEALSENEFNVKLVTEDEVFEEYMKDSTLHIV